MKCFPRKLSCCCISAVTVFILSMPYSLAFAQSGALGGLGKGLSEWAERETEKERILEMERERIRLQEEYQIRQEQRRRAVEDQRRRDLAEQERQRKVAEEAEAKRRGVTGSGFFVSQHGHLVTNYHVINDHPYLYVRDRGGRIYVAILVASSKPDDLAVLQVNKRTSGLALLPQDAVKKGQEVYAIGYPIPGLQGVESKITKGIVSSLTGIRDRESWLQIDASIQGGNSGGPLISPSGNVVGVVVASVSAAKMLAAYGSLPQNVNYAIRSDVLSSFLKRNSVPHSTSTKSRGQSSIDVADENTVMVIARGEPLHTTTIAAPSMQIASTNKDIGSQRKTEESPEQSHWKVAESIDSCAGYSEFIRLYPNSKKVALARNGFDRNDREAWKKATSVANIDSYRQYLTVCEDGKYAPEARKRISSLSNPSGANQTPSATKVTPPRGAELQVTQNSQNQIGSVEHVARGYGYVTAHLYAGTPPAIGSQVIISGARGNVSGKVEKIDARKISVSLSDGDISTVSQGDRVFALN